MSQLAIAAAVLALIGFGYLKGVSAQARYQARGTVDRLMVEGVSKTLSEGGVTDCAGARAVQWEWRFSTAEAYRDQLCGNWLRWNDGVLRTYKYEVSDHYTITPWKDKNACKPFENTVPVRVREVRAYLTTDKDVNESGRFAKATYQIDTAQKGWFVLQAEPKKQTLKVYHEILPIEENLSEKGETFYSYMDIPATFQVVDGCVVVVLPIGWLRESSGDTATCRRITPANNITDSLLKDTDEVKKALLSWSDISDPDNPAMRPYVRQSISPRFTKVECLLQ